MESLLASLPGSALLAALPGSALLLLWVVIELLFYVRYRAWVRARSAEPHATYRGADAAEAIDILWRPLTSEWPADMVRNIFFPKYADIQNGEGLLSMCISVFVPPGPTKSSGWCPTRG